MKNIFLVISFTSLVLFSGCAPMQTKGYYTTSDSNTYVIMKQGVILSSKPIILRDNGTGTILGAVAGGVLGHQVGGGTGKTVATVAGSLLGAAAGNSLNQKQGEELIIKLNSGETIKAIVNSQYYRAGDKVTVELRGGKVTRISM